MKQILILIILLINLSLSSVDNINDLINEAFQNNNGIIALKNQISSLNEMKSAAGSWNYPMLAFEYSNVPYESWRLDESPMSGIQIKLQQKLLFPGKIATKVEQSGLRIRIAELELEIAQAELSRKIKNKLGGSNVKS